MNRRVLAFCMVAVAGCAGAPQRIEVPPPPDAVSVPAAPTEALAETPSASSPAPETPAESADGAAVPGQPPPDPSAMAEPFDPLRPCEQKDVAGISVIDDTKELLEETLCGAALWVDGLFGGKGDVDAARRTRGRLEVGVYHSQFEGTRDRIRLHVRVELPVLKRRLSAFVGRDTEDDFVRDRSEGFALRSEFPQMDDQEEWLAGLGYSLPPTSKIQSDFRVGVRSLRRTRVFVQNRFGYNLYADYNDIVHLRATPFWNSRDGFGVTAGFDVSHVLTPTRLLRWDTVTTFTEVTEGLDWRNALILYQNLRKRRAIAYEAFVRGATDRAEPLAEYGLRTIFRQPLFSERLIGELVLGYSWPRDDPALEREGSASGGVGVQMPFGHF